AESTVPAGRSVGTAIGSVSEMTGKLVGPWNSASRGPVAPETTVDELVSNLATRSVQVVDVREPEEWVSGYIQGSVLMPMGEVQQRHRELDPALPVVTVCHSGVRSLFSAEELIAAGFADVRSLSGGMVAWVEAGQPVEGYHPTE
ncbi:MAG: rhodanese-like domain-containing protein, partial [Chloroflexi bacterium]|nr:rhodanese-like domain-containing protein [Chloroflexota bacterium]